MGGPAVGGLGVATGALVGLKVSSFPLLSLVLSSSLGGPSPPGPSPPGGGGPSLLLFALGSFLGSLSSPFKTKAKRTPATAPAANKSPRMLPTRIHRQRRRFGWVCLSSLSLLRVLLVFVLFPMGRALTADVLLLLLLVVGGGSSSTKYPVTTKPLVLLGAGGSSSSTRRASKRLPVLLLLLVSMSISFSKTSARVVMDVGKTGSIMVLVREWVLYVDDEKRLSSSSLARRFPATGTAPGRCGLGGRRARAFFLAKS